MDSTADTRAPVDPMVEAREAYDRGRRLYDEARYEDALGAFLDAQRLYASSDHHFNIARCYEALGRYELAVEYYRAYLRSDPRDRANIESTITRVEGLIARAEVEPEPEPVAQPPLARGPPSDEPTAPSGRGLVITGAALVGAGVALGLGGAIGVGLRARDLSEKVDAVMAGGNPDGRSLEQTRALDRQGRAFEAIQVTMAVLGGVVATGGAAMIFFGKRQRTPRTSARPVVGRTFAGVAVRGSF